MLSVNFNYLVSRTFQFVGGDMVEDDNDEESKPDQSQDIKVSSKFKPLIDLFTLLTLLT